jgi:hypothetical protein
MYSADGGVARASEKMKKIKLYFSLLSFLSLFLSRFSPSAAAGTTEEEEQQQQLLTKNASQAGFLKGFGFCVCVLSLRYLKYRKN